MTQTRICKKGVVHMVDAIEIIVSVLGTAIEIIGFLLIGIIILNTIFDFISNRFRNRKLKA